MCQLLAVLQVSVGVNATARNNRRLIALLMLQEVRRDSLVWVHCRKYAHDDVRPAPVDRRKSMARWFRDGYGTEVSDCNGLGLSILVDVTLEEAQARSTGLGRRPRCELRYC